MIISGLKSGARKRRETHSHYSHDSFAHVFICICSILHLCCVGIISEPLSSRRAAFTCCTRVHAARMSAFVASSFIDLIKSEVCVRAFLWCFANLRVKL